MKYLNVKMIIILFVSISMLIACPNQSESTGPVKICKSAGTQCKMTGGQLGVCSYKRQKLVCLSQH